MKFKVGDKVRIVGNSGHYFGIGDIVTVAVVDNFDQTYKCKKDNGESWWVAEKDIEKVEKAMKFRIGDKVRIIGNTVRGRGGHRFSIDDIVTIRAIDHDDDTRPYACEGDNGRIQWVSANDIEEAEEAMKFKVGDKVTVKSKAEIAKAYGDVDDMPGGWVFSMDDCCGKAGEIVYVDDDRYRVNLAGYSWVYGAKALTPAASTVTITFNGDATTATDGEHTATVTRYHGDEYSEETGAIEAIKKLYHRFPQVGDRYYVVYVDKTGANVDYHGFDDDAIDRGYHDTGNFYETEAAAQKVADKINAIFKEEH